MCGWATTHLRGNHAITAGVEFVFHTPIRCAEGADKAAFDAFWESGNAVQDAAAISAALAVVRRMHARVAKRRSRPLKPAASAKLSICELNLYDVCPEPWDKARIHQSNCR